MVEKHRHREFIGYQVYSTQRSLARSLELCLAPFGITTGQYNALNQLEEHGAMTQKSLAELLKKEQATVARLIDRLVKRGFVKRTPHPSDRRANIVENTPEASALLVRVEPVAVASTEAIAAGLSDEELAVFFDVLGRVRSNALAAIGEE